MYTLIKLLDSMELQWIDYQLKLLSKWKKKLFRNETKN